MEGWVFGGFTYLVHVDMGYKREALFFSKGDNSVLERVHKKGLQRSKLLFWGLCFYRVATKASNTMYPSYVLLKMKTAHL